MKLDQLLHNPWAKKGITVALLLALMLLSFFPIAKVATNPATFKDTIQSIDEKKTLATTLTAAAAVTATTLAAVPTDVTTPLANQILELSTSLLLVVCVLVLEKSLITVMGFLSFKIIIPIACLLFCLTTFVERPAAKMLAWKLVAFALVLVLIIPLSVKIGDLIYDMNRTTIQQLTEEVTNSSDNLQQEEEKQSWLDKILGTIKDGVSNVKEQAKAILNKFIDAIALFIITCCIIPIAVIFVVIWLVNLLFGLSVPYPKRKPKLFSKKEPETEDPEA
jgi:hypothetical protein